MSTLLYVLGVLAVLAGLVAIGFGTPASALDFGNTLIIAGTTAAMGGLITIGLAGAITRLQRIADLLWGPLPHEQPVQSPPPPPKPPQPERKPVREPKPAEAAPAPFEPRGPSTPPEFPPPPSVPEPPHAEAQEPEPTPPEPEPDVHQAEPPAPAPEPALREPELPPKSFFDAVWPEEKALETLPASEPASPAPESPPAPGKQRAAILKSGVVDGMGYTLYVDGSIEAELPQGTVRFASIHELRAHLEKAGG